MQPGLKNLTDHFLEEWFWRPAAIASYSAGRFSGVRSGIAWHSTLSEMGMVVISSTLAVGPISQTLDEHAAPIGKPGESLQKAFPRFADDLAWGTEAAKMQRTRSEEHTSELQSLMRNQYAVFCLKKKKNNKTINTIDTTCST